MTNAIHDENRVKVKLAVSYLDGKTLVPIKINPTNGCVKIDNTKSIAFTADKVAIRDEDREHVLMGVSSVDGKTPVPVFADPVTGAILTG